MMQSPFLKSYNSYGKSYEAANDTLRRVTESNQKFRKFLEVKTMTTSHNFKSTKNMGANAKRYDLTDLLIMPGNFLRTFFLTLFSSKTSTLPVIVTSISITEHFCNK
jgi:hypothetical protein